MFHQFQLGSQAMTLFIVHPNTNLSLVYVTICYLFHVTFVTRNCMADRPDRKKVTVFDIDTDVGV